MLTLSFVAFLDLLGFSDMVKFDCESPVGAEKHFSKLLRTHQQISEMRVQHPALEVVQFSDSIIIASPYDVGKFEEFVDIVASYQHLLFVEGVLCRGGVAYGKHFSGEGFIFSNGLIEAYGLETNYARYPRVVISPDLLELIYGNGDNEFDLIVKENDGLYFVDFLEKAEPTVAAKIMESYLQGYKNNNERVKEKIRWLIEYFDYKFPGGLDYPSRFSK